MASRTDQILRAISDELEKHRPQLDGDATLHSINLIVSMNMRVGTPHRVIFRPEWHTDVHLTDRDGRLMMLRS